MNGVGVDCILFFHLKIEFYPSIPSLYFPSIPSPVYCNPFYRMFVNKFSFFPQVQAVLVCCLAVTALALPVADGGHGHGGYSSHGVGHGHGGHGGYAKTVGQYRHL